MEEIILEDGRIAIPYSKTDGKNTFNDSIVLSPEERATITDEELEAIMQTRFDKWLSIINYVPPEEPQQ